MHVSFINQSKKTGEKKFPTPKRVGIFRLLRYARNDVIALDPLRFRFKDDEKITF